jgi:fatty-acyl-CoA synthase
VTAAGSGHEIAAYLHSGGTTGMPKVFQASHLNLSYRQWAGEYSLALTSDETVFWDLPLFHSGGLCGRFLPALGCGCSFVIPSIMGARDKKFVSQYWRFVERYRITRISGVPTTLSVLAKHPPRSEDVSCLKPYSPTGSTSMPSAVREEFQRTTGVRILVTYGLTENLANATMDPRDGPIKWGSSGIRLPYTHLRTVIVDNRHQWVRDCACDEIGEIWVRGPGVSPGTIGRDGVTVPLDTDGWLSTGDLGRLDGEGYLTVTGRAKDVIIRGGHNISPALIEEPLQASPDVLHAAAVGKLDAYAGEIPVAYVELVPGSRATSADLLHFVQPRIGERAALPKEIYILDKMPLSTVGKPLKIALRADAAVRTLRADLACRLGFSPADDRLEIEVVPHALFGSQAVIHVHCTSAHEQEQYREIATEAMGHYAVSFTVAVNVTGAAKAS